jgi:hypothetical protein
MDALPAGSTAEDTPSPSEVVDIFHTELSYSKTMTILTISQIYNSLRECQTCGTCMLQPSFLVVLKSPNKEPPKPRLRTHCLQLPPP